MPLTLIIYKTNNIVFCTQDYKNEKKKDISNSTSDNSIDKCIKNLSIRKNIAISKK